MFDLTISIVEESFNSASPIFGRLPHNYEYLLIHKLRHWKNELVWIFGKQLMIIHRGSRTNSVLHSRRVWFQEE